MLVKFLERRFVPNLTTVSQRWETHTGLSRDKPLVFGPRRRGYLENPYSSRHIPTSLAGTAASPFPLCAGVPFDSP
jgi:hypothetical protein